MPGAEYEPLSVDVNLSNKVVTVYVLRQYRIAKVKPSRKVPLISTYKLDPTLRSIDTVDGKKRIREFYAMSAEDAYALLEAIAQINGLEENLKLWDMTKDEIRQKNLSEEINSEKKDRLSNFRFSYCNLKEGDVISSLENSEIKATIIDDNHITYNGMTYTLSGLAKEITNAKTIAGPRHFTYEGKILSEIREKIEKEKR